MLHVMRRSHYEDIIQPLYIPSIPSHIVLQINSPSNNLSPTFKDLHQMTGASRSHPTTMNVHSGSASDIPPHLVRPCTYVFQSHKGRRLNQSANFNLTVPHPS